MQDLSNIMVNYLRMNGIKISNSTRKNLRRNIENTFGDEITFVTVSNNLLLYPTSMSKEKIFQELYKSREEKNGIANAANIIRKEIKDLTDELPWPPQPTDLEPDKFIIPSNLEAFLLYLFGGKEDDELSSRNSRYQHSLAQDLIYTVTGGRVKTPKSLLLPSVVIALTNNTEIITILNRLGHGVSYSILSEMLTENAYKVAEQQTDADVILPEATAKEQFTIYVADNIDRAEETLTGMTIYFHSDILCFIDCLEFC